MTSAQPRPLPRQSSDSDSREAEVLEDRHSNSHYDNDSLYDHEEGDGSQYRATSGQSFTPRSLLVGLAIGIAIVFSNTYFGLQTGWVSSMAMPSSLIGFAVFKTVSKHLSFPFSPVENVLIQTVAGAVGTMPLGCGFVGVIPALEFLLKGEGGEDREGNSYDEGGPLRLSFLKLVVWSVGVCLFGVVFAVPLRREVIIREKLPFPSGTASALMIRVLHPHSGNEKAKHRRIPAREREQHEHETQHLLHEGDSSNETELHSERARQNDWRRRIVVLSGAFGVSAVYTLISYFVPQIRNVPILGLTLSQKWLWALNPSPAYIGQGIIMGPATSFHMLIGAILGWGILSPLAKRKGWAPGDVEDWEHGSKGWIVWVSLAIMLADSIVSLGWLIIRLIKEHGPRLLRLIRHKAEGSPYLPMIIRPSSSHVHTPISHESLTPDSDDAPPSQLISNRTALIILPLTLALNVACMQFSFGNVITPWLSTLATLLALVLSIMGVRALGETDLNPVSGISKLTQLMFAAATPASRHSNRSAIVTNLLAGAVSESGALQAGDMLQDLKTGHVLHASPKAQFYGQVIGSLVGAVISTAVYKMYVNVYDIPGQMFQVPTAYVWLFTARLVTGQGLPEKAWAAAIIASVIFAAVTVLRIIGAASNGGKGASWRPYIPGGIAVAVGMYNVPSFTLARAIGGLIAWVSNSRLERLRKGRTLTREETPLTSAAEHGSPSRADASSKTSGDSSLVVILASGLILGEGVVSIVNLALAGARVPHL